MKSNKFNKNYFRVWLALVLILLGVTLINYGDYKEYDINCFDTICTYNKTFFKDKYVIEHNLNENREEPLSISNEGRIYSGEYLIFSNYEETPNLIKNFFKIVVLSLMLTFLLNYVWFKKQRENDKTI